MTAILVAIWFLTMVGIAVVITFIYDLVEKVLNNRNKMAEGGLDFSTRVAALDNRITSTEARINALQNELDMYSDMTRISKDLDKVIEIYKELETNEETATEDKRSNH